MEEQDKNLEHFFKKKFAQDPKPEPWNTPDNTIWEGIAGQIQAEKKEKKKSVLWLPFLFCAIGFALAGYFYSLSQGYSRKIRELELKLEVCGSSPKKAEGAVLPSDHQILPVSTTIEKTSLAGAKNPPQISYLGKPSYPDKPSYLSTPKPNTDFNLPNAGFPSNISPAGVEHKYMANGERANSDISNTFQTNLPIPDAQGGQNLNPETENFIKVDKNIPFLNILSPKLLDIPQKSVQQTPIVSNGPLIKPTKAHPIYVGVSIGALFWKEHKTGNFNNSLSELITRESTKNTIQYGWIAKYGISKHLALDAGAFYAMRVQTSHYALSIPYTISTEQLTINGGYDNTFQHSLPSGLGYVNTQLTVNRPENAPVANNEAVDLDFAFQHRTSVLFIPMQVSFYSKQVGKGLFGAIGINHEILLRNKIAVITAKSKHATIQEKSVGISAGTQQQTRYNAQGTLQLGYQYPLTRNISCVLTGGYNLALTQHFQTAQYHHKIDHWSVGLGLLRVLR